MSRARRNTHWSRIAIALAAGTILIGCALPAVGQVLQPGVPSPRRPGFQPRPPVPGQPTAPGTTPGAPGTTAQGQRGFLPEGIDIVAGVLLDRTAQLTADLADVSGAVIDPDSGRFILIGKRGKAETHFNPEDLLVAFRAAIGAEDGKAPGVSIEGPILDGQMTVRYLGGTQGTHFGQVMFEADRLLKCLAMGRDNITGKPLRANVPGYRTELELLSAFGGAKYPGAWHRYWFRPAQVVVSLSPDGTGIVFDKVEMAALTEYVPPLPEGSSEPASEAFCRHITEHYDEYAAEFPVLAELKNLTRMVALANWVVQRGIPINKAKLMTAPLPMVATPATTPMGFAEITERVPAGWMKHQMKGGVDLSLRTATLSRDRPRNWFAGVSTEVQDLKRAVLSTPSQSPRWDVKMGNTSYTAVVLAQAPKKPAKPPAAAKPTPKQPK